MKAVLFLAMALLLISCYKEKRRPVYHSDIPIQEDDHFFNNDEIIILFREESGVKYIPVKVNGLACDMIFDTGCSLTLISLIEAASLYQKGELLEDDFIGISRSQIADGTVVENMVVNLREIILDDKIICRDVVATVSTNVHAPLLLGNEVLNRLATITIDNENKYLIFKLKQP
ncbi:MAG: clan AA aspartic protease [Parabacteroides sp.]|nr:clan AA aspartic protease [Parabacteroides sp.]